MVTASRRPKLIGIATLVLAGLSAVACFETPTAPATPDSPLAATSPSLSKGSGNTEKRVLAEGLLRLKPLTQAATASREISSAKGGVINVPGTDFQLRIPAGAFAERSVRFTVTAMPGSMVAYDFQPHGMTFLKPLLFTQKLDHTNWKDASKRANFTPAWNGAYFAESTQLNQANGTARIDEFMPANLDLNDATLTFSIPHFSGYMVSSGHK